MSVDLQLSRALHYGHGCFTTLVYRDGLPLLWEYHWQRLQQAALILGLHCEENALRKQLQQMIDVQTEHAGILKILLLDESPANGYEPPQYAKTQVLILPRVLDRQWLAEKRQKGCQLMRCQYRLAHQSVLAGVKHLNRLDQVLASRELQQTLAQDGQPPVYDDGVMLDVNDFVIETTCANLFVRIGSQWVTPDLSFAGVAGVARSLIIRHLVGLQELIQIRPIHWSEFCVAEEIFICNSVRGIWPVVRLQEKTLPIGALTRNLQKNLQLCFV